MNESQCAAICADAPHLLVLAGAGTGKTRTLIHRIAWFIERGEASRGQIMTVTFTNRAATELKERLTQLPGVDMHANRVLAGTFHSMARRQLVEHGSVIDLKPNFTIMDSDDQKRLVRQLMRENNVNERHFPAVEFAGWLSRHKEVGNRADDVADEEHSTYKTLYQAYEEHCRKNSLVDFSELLLAACEMMECNEEVRQLYQRRYSCLLVDEFQDTNAIQYRWLKNMAGPQTCTTVVGDDDQTIYTWRGARAENMEEYRSNFDATVVRLERNYRSTERILQAANQVIRNNQQRMGKNLICTGEQGEKVRVYSAANEQDEARFVASIVEDWHTDNRKLSDIAVLYRSNTQSRVLEEEMIRLRIPYRIYGGTRFYSRAEIKDVLAYLHLVHNPNDNLAFRRAVGVPKRGVGEKTLERLQAIDPDSSLWQNLVQFCSSGAGKSTALQQFAATIDSLRNNCEGKPLKIMVEQVLALSGLKEMYEKISGEGGLSKADNLDELAKAAGEFEKRISSELHLEKQEPISSPLEQFLAEAALNSGDEQSPTGMDSIHLMTLHASKGLEFPLVMMVGMEQDLFPHIKSIQNQGLEEERRLCYVGMTRAREKLYMSWASARHSGNRPGPRTASRFLRELDPELVEEMGSGMATTDYRTEEPPMRTTNGSTTPKGNSGSGPVQVGRKVYHKTFGDGVVLRIEGRVEDARIQISFADHGVKWLLLSHANLALTRSES